MAPLLLFRMTRPVLWNSGFASVSMSSQTWNMAVQPCLVCEKRLEKSIGPSWVIVLVLPHGAMSTLDDERRRSVPNSLGTAPSDV